MKELTACIDRLRAKVAKHRKSGLKEAATKKIFIEPMLEALGWDLLDPDEVELEYPTVDSKAVDYALKINHSPVLLVEAKALDNPLTDVKAITQVVGYAANDGIVWCVLTNGVKWQIYRSIEKKPAPDKLMYEICIDPHEESDATVSELARRLAWLSKEEMLKGSLDTIGEQRFCDAKVRGALDSLMADPPRSLINAIIGHVGDESLTGSRIKASLGRIWQRVETQSQTGQPIKGEGGLQPGAAKRGKAGAKDFTCYATLQKWIFEALAARGGAAKLKDIVADLNREKASVLTNDDKAPQTGHESETCFEYRCRWAVFKLRKAGIVRPMGKWGLVELVQGAEGPKGPSHAPGSRKQPPDVKVSAGLLVMSREHHLADKPSDTVQIFDAVDSLCLGLAPGQVERVYCKSVIRYTVDQKVFCSAVVRQKDILLYLQLKYSDLDRPPENVRDVSAIGHWGAGDLEVRVSSLAEIEGLETLIRGSLEESRAHRRVRDV